MEEKNTFNLLFNFVSRAKQQNKRTSNHFNHSSASAYKTGKVKSCCETSGPEGLDTLTFFMFSITCELIFNKLPLHDVDESTDAVKV